MTDNEIIKALECCFLKECNCRACPLKDENVCAINVVKQAVEDEVKKAKSEAIKEFAEKVKQTVELNDLKEYNYVCKLLDILIKEMTEVSENE